MAQVLKDSVRNKIIEASKAAFLENGLDASMRDIAKRAHITVGNIYRYFDSKEEIIFTIIHRPLILLNEAVEKASDYRISLEKAVEDIDLREADYKEAFLGIGDTLTDIYATYPDEMTILINDPSSNERLRLWFTDLLSALLKQNAKVSFSDDDVRAKFANAAAISIFYGIRECLLPDDIQKTKELVRIYLYSFISLLYMED